MVEVKERPKEGTQTRSAVPTVRKIGIVGAGQMGNGIAHVCALSGFHVMLNDIVPDRISEGLATINGNLARQVSRQRISDEQRQAAIKLIVWTVTPVVPWSGDRRNSAVSEIWPPPMANV